MKSQDKTFVLSLLSKVFEDSSFCVRVIDRSRDMAYVTSRFAREGFPFLSKTLPRFFKAVLVGVETGTFIPPMGFKTLKGSLLPSFMSGWTRRIFAHDGSILAEPDPHSFGELYQVCALFYKTELPHSSSEESAVVDTFKTNEREVKDFVLPDDSHWLAVRSLARGLLNGVLGDLDPKSIHPRHGPGAVATGERGNAKYHWKRKYQRLHSKYPYYEYFSPSLSRLSFSSPWYKRLVEDLNPIAKVTLVPKDSRGPRLISMEPLEIQWIQQGLSRLVTDRVEKHHLTRGKVNFTDQTVNRELALKASLDRVNATLDLRDASDRIPLSLVRDLFPQGLVEHMEACRSVATLLPDGVLQPLSKFAPMGSALCFPVLALTVWALSEAALRLSHRSRSSVYVYGDDLIVPSVFADTVSDVLAAHCLKVNGDKSFIKGPFRESCGIDAFNDVVVTPIRVRRPFRGTHPDPAVYTHLIELSESFFNRGYWSTCDFLRKHVTKVFGKIPWTHDRSYPGFFCPDRSACAERNTRLKKRWKRRFQRQEVLVRRVVDVNRADAPLMSASRMLKGLTGLYAYAGEDYRVALRGQSVLRSRWCAA